MFSNKIQSDKEYFSDRKSASESDHKKGGEQSNKKNSKIKNKLKEKIYNEVVNKSKKYVKKKLTGKSLEKYKDQLMIIDRDEWDLILIGTKICYDRKDNGNFIRDVYISNIKYNEETEQSAFTLSFKEDLSGKSYYCHYNTIENIYIYKPNENTKNVTSFKNIEYENHINTLNKKINKLENDLIKLASYVKKNISNK